MSKSIGNAVSVVEAAERVSPTALRYFLFMEGVPLQKELLYESFINPGSMEVSTEGVMVHGGLIQMDGILKFNKKNIVFIYAHNQRENLQFWLSYN